MVALGVSFIICIVWTLIAPEKNANYDAYKTIELEDCEDINDTNTDDPMAMNRALRVRLLACLLACDVKHTQQRAASLQKRHCRGSSVSQRTVIAMLTLPCQASGSLKSLRHCLEIYYG